MLRFTTDMFDYDKKDKTFSQESSTLDLSARDWNSLSKLPEEHCIEILNMDSGGSRRFHFTHVDISHGEVYGWNYESKDGIKLLIIND